MAGRYVPLSVNFFGDNRVVELPPLARLVFIAGLVIAKREESDGRLTLGQVRRECFDFDVESLVNELVASGLWAREGEGVFTVPSWLKWNRSKDWIDGLRAARVKAGQFGGQKSGQVRKSKQVASTTRSKLLGHDEANLLGRDEANIKKKSNNLSSPDPEGVRVTKATATPKATALKAVDEPLRAKAQELTCLAFEQAVKPVIRAEGRGGTFVAAKGIIRKILDGGEAPERVEAAIKAGVGVWTIAGFQTAMAKLPCGGGPHPAPSLDNFGHQVG